MLPSLPYHPHECFTSVSELSILSPRDPSRTFGTYRGTTAALQNRYRSFFLQQRYPTAQTIPVPRQLQRPPKERHGFLEIRRNP